MTNANDDFFANAPENYEVPKTESRYLNFKEPGAYKFRILEKPVFGWLGWKVVNGKDTPCRFPYAAKPADTSAFKNGEIAHIWLMPVWNFKNKRVEILELNKKGIMQDIEKYARNEDWGSPLGYNITVTREGTTRENTKYHTVASPHSKLPEDVQAGWNETKAAGFEITELFKDGDPFKPGSPIINEDLELVVEDTAEPAE